MVIRKIVALLLCLHLALTNLIISVTPSSNQVGEPQVITVLIKTSTNLDELDFVISNAFDITNPICTKDG